MADFKYTITNYGEAEKVWSEARKDASGRVKIGYMTWLVIRFDEGTGRAWYGIVHHETRIVSYFTDGTIGLDNGGWDSKTTRERLCEFTPADFRIHRVKGETVITRLGVNGWDDAYTTPFHGSALIGFGPLLAA